MSVGVAAPGALSRKCGGSFGEASASSGQDALRKAYPGDASRRRTPPGGSRAVEEVVGLTRWRTRPRHDLPSSPD